MTLDVVFFFYKKNVRMYFEGTRVCFLLQYTHTDFWLLLMSDKNSVVKDSTILPFQWSVTKETLRFKQNPS